MSDKLTPKQFVDAFPSGGYVPLSPNITAPAPTDAERIAALEARLRALEAQVATMARERGEL